MRADRRRLTHSLNKIYGRSAKRPRTLRCAWCKEKIKVKSQGRLPRFCSHSCRQRAYERAKWGRPHLAALRSDLATVAMRAAIREEAWAMLQQAGLLPVGATPPAMSRRNRTALRIVPPEGDTG